jgi:hypothetical protein
MIVAAAIGCKPMMLDSAPTTRYCRHGEPMHNEFTAIFERGGGLPSRLSFRTGVRMVCAGFPRMPNARR